MLAREIIKLSHAPDINFHSIVEQALNTALWHYILFFNENDDIDQKLFCLLEESLSKLLFRFFCERNNLAVEFNSDNNDRFLSFQIEGDNWELINLSLKRVSAKLNFESADLPAMIPSNKLDCKGKDKFGARIVRWKEEAEKKVLFTYLHDNSAKECFLTLKLPNGLKQFYLDFFNQKVSIKKMHESDFKKKLDDLGMPEFSINHKPDFYITAWTKTEHLKFFYNSNPQDFPQIKMFCFENKSLLIHRLPAFSRLFPQLNEKLYFGKFLT